AISSAYWPASVSGGSADRHALAGEESRAGPAATTQLRGGSRPGHDLSQVPAKRTAAKIRLGRRIGRRPASLSEQPTHSGPPDWSSRPLASMAATQPGSGGLAGGGGVVQRGGSGRGDSRLRFDRRRAGQVPGE